MELTLDVEVAPHDRALLICLAGIMNQSHEELSTEAFLGGLKQRLDQSKVAHRVAAACATIEAAIAILSERPTPASDIEVEITN